MRSIDECCREVFEHKPARKSRYRFAVDGFPILLSILTCFLTRLGTQENIEKGLFLYSKKKGFEMGAEKKEKKIVRKRFCCK